MVLLAVYGTLKEGNHNHNVHLNSSPVFADYVSLNGKLFTNGRYPMLIKSEIINEIYVEIYDITEDTLSNIDQLEEPFGYHREQLKFDVGLAWIYYYSKGIPPENFKEVRSGNFVKEQEW